MRDFFLHNLVNYDNPECVLYIVVKMYLQTNTSQIVTIQNIIGLSGTIMFLLLHSRYTIENPKISHVLYCKYYDLLGTILHILQILW